MTEETQIIRKNREEPIGDSHMFQISVRAWLAIILVGTICLHSGGAIFLAIKNGQPDLLKVTEPLYTMGGMALAYYFGQQKQSGKPSL